MATVAALKGAVGSSDQIMVDNLGYVEAGLKVEVSIVKGPVFGSWSVKEGEFLFHLVDGLEDKSLILSAKTTSMAQICWLKVLEGSSWTLALFRIVPMSSWWDKASIGAMCALGRAR